MQYKKENLIATLDELQLLLEKPNRITYLNMYSLHVGGSSNVNSRYIVDGWPLKYYFKFLHKVECDLLPFYRLERFWLEMMRSRSFSIIGHSTDELEIISQFCLENKLQCKNFYDGFQEIDEIVSIIESEETVDLIFLATGQPKQENILENLKSHSACVIACGAFFRQLSQLEPDVPNLARRLGVGAIYRWHRQPVMVIRRTILPLVELLLYRRIK